MGWGFSRTQDVGASGGRHPFSLLEVRIAEMWGWGLCPLAAEHQSASRLPLRGHHGVGSDQHIPESGKNLSHPLPWSLLGTSVSYSSQEWGGGFSREPCRDTLLTEDSLRTYPAADSITPERVHSCLSRDTAGSLRIIPHCRAFWDRRGRVFM